MADLTINGDCDPRFERVRGAFVENFQRRGEVGAAVSVMVDGHCAVGPDRFARGVGIVARRGRRELSSREMENIMTLEALRRAGNGSGPADDGERG